MLNPLSFMNEQQAREYSGGEISHFKAFYPNECHVCHRLDNKENPLKRCGNCQLMTYCSREHQVKNWKMHKNICKIFKQLGGPEMFSCLKDLRDPPNASNETKFQLLKQRVWEKRNLFKNVMLVLHRKPFLYEMEVLLYPRVCAICFEYDQSLLTSCYNCPQVSFCREHKNDPSHAKECHLFKRAWELSISDPQLISFFQMELKQFKALTAPTQEPGARLPNSMNDFLSKESCIKISRSPRQEDILSRNIFDIYLTEALCPPLTILWALEKLQFPVSSNLTIHVVGATDGEIVKSFWEIIFHWLPEVTNLNITFIGPDISLSRQLAKEALCASCTSKKVQMNLRTSDDYYQKFMTLSSYVKPNFIVAYNAGLHAYPAWIPAIKSVITLRCPFIQTSFTDIEAYQDHKLIESIVPGVKYFYYGVNPFASHFCERNSDDERIFARSEFLTIYDIKDCDKKCSKSLKKKV